MITTADSLEFLKTFDDFTFDINYSDPPYQLGSEVIIRKDGKVDYKKSVDFMNKWGGLSGEYWEQWFKEAYRTLKHGGYLIMFGMDRQLLLFKYYANLAGFEEQQSLYWYFISNFPKATDLSKQIDKNAGAEREVIGKNEIFIKRNPNDTGINRFITTKDGINKDGRKTNATKNISIENITTPSTDLAKKYEGYKYSISPLKQTNETIMVFRKPYKSGSCLHDTLAFENGDNECRCGALNIDGNRVATSENRNRTQKQGPLPTKYGFNNNSMGNRFMELSPLGRYPSQTFCDSNTAEVLDKQSGISKSSNNRINKIGTPTDSPTSFGVANKEHEYSDTGGCSKILHKCNFEEEDYDIYNYQPKVSKSERNAGCDELPIKERVFNGTSENCSKDIKDVELRFTTSPTSNNHPTLKPIKLNERILKLFKTPNEQKIIYPFAGSGSEVIGGLKAGFTNWVGCEINPDYVEIAKARIEHWTTQDNQLTIFDIERK